MEFNNYCLLVLGNVKEVENTLKNITEEEVKFVIGKGFFIGSFLSILTPEEIKNCFIREKSSVIVFNLNSDSSSIELSDKDKHDYLFKEILKNNHVSEKLTQQYGSMINIDKKETESLILENTKKSINNLDKDARKKMMDEIIDKGVDNMTDSDKELLEFLTKSDDQ